VGGTGRQGADYVCPAPQSRYLFGSLTPPQSTIGIRNFRGRRVFNTISRITTALLFVTLGSFISGAIESTFVGFALRDGVGRRRMRQARCSRVRWKIPLVHGRLEIRWRRRG
jgi:hypothetical protein